MLHANVRDNGLC